MHVAIFYQSKMIDILKRPLDGHQISTVAELLDSGMVIGFPANFAVSTGGTFCKVAQKFPLWCYKFFHFGKKRRELERKKCFNFLIHHALNKPPKGTDRNFFFPPSPASKLDTLCMKTSKKEAMFLTSKQLEKKKKKNPTRIIEKFFILQRHFSPLRSKRKKKNDENSNHLPLGTP